MISCLELTGRWCFQVGVNFRAKSVILMIYLGARDHVKATLYELHWSNFSLFIEYIHTERKPFTSNRNSNV